REGTMSAGQPRPGGIGMRDVVVRAVDSEPPSPELLLEELASIAAAGGGVTALLDAACQLGAHAALIRPAPPPRADGASVVTDLTDDEPGATGTGTPREGDDDGCRQPGGDRPAADQPTERLELPLRAAPATRGTLVLA